MRPGNIGWRLRVERMIAEWRGRPRVLYVADDGAPAADIRRDVDPYTDAGCAVSVVPMDRLDGGRVSTEEAVRRLSPRRMERVTMLAAVLSRDSGRPDIEIRREPDLGIALGACRSIEALRPALLHSRGFGRASFITLVASHLLGIPRVVSAGLADLTATDAVGSARVHLRQACAILADSDAAASAIRAREPRCAAAHVIAGHNLEHAQVRRLLDTKPVIAPHAPRTDPAVSIVMPFFNAERFIEDTIDSVLLQTWDSWELLLADDGSSDRSTVIARSYAHRFPGRIRYLEHEGHRNRGASPTRNFAVASHAVGNLVAFLDADDVWTPCKLAQQVALLESHPDVAMLFGAAEYWAGWTGRPEDAATDYTPTLGVEADRVYSPPTLSLELHPLGVGTAPCPSDLIVRRDDFLAVGGFDESFVGELQLFEDQTFLAKMYLTRRVLIAGASWIRYRLHEASCVSTVTRAGRDEAVREEFFAWLSRYVGERGLFASEVRDAIARVRA